MKRGKYDDERGERNNKYLKMSYGVKLSSFYYSTRKFRACGPVCMYVNIMRAGKVLLIKDYPVKQKIECDN